MTLRAGVRRAERNRQIGARHAKAVIAPNVDDHVGLGRRMAVDALGAGGARLVMVVFGCVEFRLHMALGAQRIAFRAQLCAVRVVTVGAGDPAACIRLCRNEPYS